MFCDGSVCRQHDLDHWENDCLNSSIPSLSNAGALSGLWFMGKYYLQSFTHLTLNPSDTEVSIS